MQKSLQRKIRSLQADPSSSREFILGDAKESDLALHGMPSSLGRSLERPDASFPYASREAFLDQIAELAETSPLDLMLVSPSVAEATANHAGVFSRSAVSPAVRSAQDHWLPPAAALEGGPVMEGPLPLFGVGFCKDERLDQSELDAYERFRFKAGAARVRHLLELYPSCGCDGGVPQRVNDVLPDRLLHSLLEVPPVARPLLVQAPYYGPRLMESLAASLPGMPVGIVGGPAGTTLDAFRLLAESKRYGARAALFGRRISAAEHQPAFIQFLEYLAKDDVRPDEAVHAYHGVLQGLGIRPFRDLQEDLKPTAELFHGDETSNACVVVPEFPMERPERAAARPMGAAAAVAKARPSESNRRADASREPDFSKMSVEEKLEYNQRERDRIFG